MFLQQLAAHEVMSNESMNVYLYARATCLFLLLQAVNTFYGLYYSQYGGDSWFLIGIWFCHC